MSRLEEHKKKLFYQKIWLYFGLIIFLIYFIFTYGFKLILNTSVWIANLNSKKNTPEIIKNNNFFGRVDIDNILTATNSSSTIISFTVNNFDTTEIYLNGKKIKEINTNNQDSFTEEIFPLKKGSNEIYLLAKNKQYQKEKQSAIYQVFYKDEKPKLEVKEPLDNSKTHQSEIKISGETDKETFIKVNDYPVVVDAQNNFQTSLSLKPGENTIVITAQDEAGNIETKELRVIYEKED
jgi:hypothetical protein